MLTLFKMNYIYILFKYISYLIYSISLKKIHSPFQYNYLINLIYNNAKFIEASNNIELLRRILLKDNEKILFVDNGAKKNKDEFIKIKTIAKNSTKSKKYCRLLFNTISFFKSKNILELGTSLGISTMYLSEASENGKITTIEGCPEIALKAKNNFREMKINNIEIFTARFDDVIDDLLKNNCYDLIFIDGNHTKEATIDYFNKCLMHSNEDTILIFDDIHWSKDMESAWDTIKNNERVNLTIDFFFIGIVFFKKELTKQNITVRY